MSVAVFPKYFSAYLNTLGGAQAGTLNGLPSGTAVTPPFHQTLEFQARRGRVAIHQFPINYWVFRSAPACGPGAMNCRN
jgi:hypothetical protein